jgi:hypothetical protein
MDKWVQTLLGSAAVALAWTAPHQVSAQPTAPALPSAQTYADLLEPIPNALTLARADDGRLAQAAAARVVPVRDFHHHHHHHHHHHNGFSLRFGAPYGYSSPVPYYPAPYCHWALGSPHWNGWRWVRPRIRVCD